MKNEKNQSKSGKINRRKFISTAGKLTAGAIAAPFILRVSKALGMNDLNVAIIGTGTQGRVLINDGLKIPNVRFKAICDIWKFSQKYAKGILKNYGHVVNIYEDYKEMLEKEKDIDAVIVATPDWMHAEHTIACLKAGKHVYSEKEMSNTLEKAASMVKASQDTKKLLQIGHQRRSNPVYQHALKMIDDDKVCGKLLNCFGQWNRPVQPKLKWSKRLEIDKGILKKYGYGSMDRFRNWRWYKDFSAGPIADLGSHQIDIFSWFLHAEPKSVVAVGGKDYYKDREWFENVMAIYEYETRSGSARAFYQVLNTTGFGSYYERFHGDKGTITISESSKKCYYVPEVGASIPEWMSSAKRVERDGHQAIPFIDALTKKNSKAASDMATFKKKNVHQFHLENFFNAVRANDMNKLSCPGEAAYPTAVAVLNVIPAIEAGKKIKLSGKAYEGGKSSGHGFFGWLKGIFGK